MPTTSAKGIPLPVVGDNNAVVADLTAAVNDIDTIIGPYSTASIAAMAAAKKWAGRIVYDSTLNQYFRYDTASATFIRFDAIQAYTTAQITAFVAAERWGGRIVFDSTLGIYKMYDATAAAWIRTYANEAYSTAEITAFVASERWDGREVYDTTLKNFKVYDLATTTWRISRNGGTPTGRLLRISRAAGQVVGVSSNAYINFDAETADPEGWFAASNTIFTCQRDGFYAINLAITPSSGNLFSFAIHDGAGTTPRSVRTWVSGNANGDGDNVMVAFLRSGSTYRVNVQTDSSGACTFTAALDIIRLSF